jgi:hypothetical protein
MTKLFIPSAVAVLLLALAGCGPAADAQQSGTVQAPQIQASVNDGLPRTQWDGKPDLSGVWGGPLPADGTASTKERQQAGEALKGLYQPWALARTNSLKYTEDPRLHCAPYGFPRYMSDSRARWEGDTLVVDVTGFNGKTWLAGSLLSTGNVTAGMGDGGTMTSDALHVVERWRLVDRDTLEYWATVDDPKVLTGTWTTPRYRVRRAVPGTIINEALCIAPEDLQVIQAAQK